MSAKQYYELQISLNTGCFLIELVPMLRLFVTLHLRYGYQLINE